MLDVTALKQEMEAGVFVAMFWPLPPGEITDFSDGKARHVAPLQDFSIKELRCLCAVHFLTSSLSIEKGFCWFFNTPRLIPETVP
jgi:hypothetical protein